MSSEFHLAAAATLDRIRRDRAQAPPGVARVLLYVEEHLFERGLNVVRLRRDCGLSDNLVLRRFTSLLGRTPYAYIEDRRLETACRLLLDTDLKVWRIAETLGYSSLQVFSRAFARWSGRRPTAYRAETGEKAPLPRPSTTPKAEVGHPEVDRRSRAATRRRRSRAAPDHERIAAIQAEEIRAELERRPEEERASLIAGLGLSSPALTRLLNAESRVLARQDPRRALHLARLGLVAAEALAARGGRALSIRGRIESWTAIADAHRAARQLRRARRALKTARAWSTVESPEPMLLATLLRVETALLRAEGRLREALRRTDEALAAARKSGDRQMLAEALMEKARILSDAGDPAGVVLLEKALALKRR